jgi:hypothetical protein
MKEHYLDSSVTQPFWDNSIELRLDVDPGEVVILDFPEPTGQITSECTLDTLKAADVDFNFGPLDSSVYQRALVHDPDGNQIGIHRRKGN